MKSARVLEFNPESRRLKLELKQLCELWDTAEERYAAGKALKAKVAEAKRLDYGQPEPGRQWFHNYHNRRH